MKIIPKCIKTKRHLCASGSILLPLAQKWGLVGVVVMAALSALGAQTVSAASLTIEIPTNPLTVNASASGGFSEASGKVSVKGDAHWGYVLSIQSKNSKNVLTSKEGNTIASITEAKSKTNFPDNAWGYKFGKDNANISNNNFQPGPTTKETLDTTNASGNHDYSFTIGAKVNTNQPAGNYSNTFTITATANTVNYNISYDGCNCGTTDNTSQGTTTEPTVTLLNTNQKKPNYVFQGWCKKNAETGACADNIVYKAGTGYPLADGENEATLLGVWKPEGSQRWMQTFQCSSLSDGGFTTLVDARDGNTYSVAKLKDGKCWMTQDLRFGDEKLTDRKLTPIDSDVKDCAFEIPQSAFTFHSSWHDPYFYISEEGNAYYSWNAATAGSSEKLTEQGAAEESVCPKGWSLPINGEFTALAEAYSNDFSQLVEDRSNNMPQFNTNAVIIDGAWTWANYGFYWNSYGYGANALDIELGRGTRRAIPDEWSGSSHGHQLRCVARE